MEYTIHHARLDDSFHRLAHRYNTSPDDIIRTHNQTANPNIPLTIDSTIHPGDKIHIPVTQKTADSVAFITYKLDGMTSINTLARYYGVTVEEVRAFNTQPVQDIIGDEPVLVPIKAFTTADTDTNAASNTATEQQTDSEGTTTETESPLAICTPTACEELQLIVEIVGKIPADYEQQKVVIFTEEDKYDAAKTNKVQKEAFIEETETSRTSVLHKWDWKTTDKGHLWLEIKSTKEEPIRMPLLNGKTDLQKANLTPLKSNRHAQDNLIVPIVPTTETIARSHYATYKPLEDVAVMASNTPVLCRAGWLYVFREGKLWREVEIRQDQTTGKTTYHDVRLYGTGGFLDANGRVKNSEKREAEGVALEDIWLPARFNGVSQELQVFYAESQLTAARINEYLKKPEVLKKRAHTVCMEPQSILLDRYSSRLNSSNNPFLLYGKVDNRVNYAQGHLPRDLAREALLQEPAKFLKSRSYLTDVFNKTEKLHKAIADPQLSSGRPIDNITGKYTTSIIVSEGYLIADLSISAWGYHLKEKLKKEFCIGAPTTKELENPQSPWVKYQVSEEDKEVWYKTPAGQEELNNKKSVLQEAVDKRICGLFLFDALNWASYLQQQIHQCWEIQKLLADQTTLRDNHGSAVLVQNVMYESGTQDKDDPRYKAVQYHINARDNVGKRIEFALGGRERYLVRREIDIRQNLLLNVIKHPMTVESIKDTTACLGLDKLGGCKNLTNIIMAFSSATTTDPLMAPSRVAKTSITQRAAYKLLEEGQPYYKVLYEPVEDTNELLEEYKKLQIVNVEPRGDGLWQPEAFADLEKMPDSVFEQQIQQEKIRTVQGSLVALESKMGLNETKVITQKAVSALVAYAGNISTMINKQVELLSKVEADKEILDDSNKIQTANEQKLQNELDSLKNEQQEIIHNKLPANKREINTRQTEIDRLESEKTRSIAKYDLLTEKIERRIAQLNSIKASPTATDTVILSWTNTTAVEKALQQIVAQKRENNAKLVALYAEQDRLTQRITDIDVELDNKQQEITRTKADIQTKRGEVVNNKRGVNVRLREKLGFTSLNVARQLAADSLGNIKLQQDLDIHLDANGKINADLQPGEWIPIGIFNDDLVDNIGDGRRRDIYQAEIGIIKVDAEGNAIPPKGLSTRATNTALSQGHNVVVRGFYIVMNRSSKMYSDLRKAIRALKAELAEARAQYQGLADTKAGLLHDREAVNKEIAKIEQETAELSKQQEQLLEERKNQQIEQRERQITELGEQRDLTQEKINTNEARIRELEQQQQLSSAERTELNNRRDELARQRATLETQNSQYNTDRAKLDGDIAKIESDIKTVNEKILRLQGHTLFSNLASKSSRTIAMAGIRIRNTAINVMQSPAMPFVMAGFEVWNAIELIDKIKENGATTRNRAEGFALLFNSLSAIEGMVAVFYADSARYNAIIAQKSRIPVPAILARVGIKTISIRFLLQGPGAAIGGGLAIADMVTDIQNRDWGALIGDSILLASAVAGLTATIMGTAGLLATPVVGWIILASFVLLAIGVTIKALFQDTPFEKWIKHGPFGDSPSTNYTYLGDEKEAFYQLVGLLAQLKLTVKELRAKDISQEQWQTFAGEPKPKQLIMASLTSAIPWLLGNSKEYYLAGDIHIAAYNASGKPNNMRKPDYYYQQKTPYGINFYLDCTNDILPIAREELAQIKIPAMRSRIWQPASYLTRIQIEMIGQESATTTTDTTTSVVPYLFPIPDNQLMQKKINFTNDNRKLPELISLATGNKNFWLTDHYKLPRGGFYSFDNNHNVIELTASEAKRLGYL